jgi:hypothetical protein
VAPRPKRPHPVPEMAAERPRWSAPAPHTARPLGGLIVSPRPGVRHPTPLRIRPTGAAPRPNSRAAGRSDDVAGCTGPALGARHTRAKALAARKTGLIRICVAVAISGTGVRPRLGGRGDEVPWARTRCGARPMQSLLSCWGTDPRATARARRAGAARLATCSRITLAYFLAHGAARSRALSRQRSNLTLIGGVCVATTLPARSRPGV